MPDNPTITRAGPVAGVDEAGRGPLAGPVVAAAVILDPRRRIRGLADSKRLAPQERERLALRITARSAAWAVAWAERAEIDSLNILGATMLAMRRAIIGLPRRPHRVLVDGNRLPELADLGCDGLAVVGGDGRVPAISAASIIAKVTRDEIMRGLDRLHPGYGFARHKGYCTRLHFESLATHGPCEAHRVSFAPVRAALLGRSGG